MPSPSDLITAALAVTSNALIPRSRIDVSRGLNLFGAAILSKDNLQVLTNATNSKTTPLHHGEVTTLLKFFEHDFPDAKTRPNTSSTVFFSTHEPCNMCMGSIAWSFFDTIVYLFSYEELRDLFDAPLDIAFTEAIYRVSAPCQSLTQDCKLPRYKKNDFFTVRSLSDIAAEIPDEGQCMQMSTAIESRKRDYDALVDEWRARPERQMEKAVAEARKQARARQHSEERISLCAAHNSEEALRPARLG